MLSQDIRKVSQYDSCDEDREANYDASSCGVDLKVNHFASFTEEYPRTKLSVVETNVKFHTN